MADLSQPGTWDLGWDQTLNIVAYLVTLISPQNHRITFSPPDWTADDTLRFKVETNNDFTLIYGPALTLAEIDEALTEVGIDPERATEEQRDLIKQLLKSIQLGD